MASKKDVLDRIDFVTDRLSTQVRTLSLGLLAVTWGLLIGDSSIAQDISHSLKAPLVLVAASSILVLLLDFTQYGTAYLDAMSVLGKMEREKLVDVKYDTKRLTYRLQSVLFIGKQLILIAASVALLAALGCYLLQK